MLTETNIRNAYAYCEDDISLIENYEEAVNDDKRYVCHHKNGLNKSTEQLKEEGLYFHRPPEELIFLSISEHMRLHNKGENNPMYGVHRYGEKHPNAKQCTINSVTYGCLKDAASALGISYSTIKKKYKNNKL